MSDLTKEQIEEARSRLMMTVGAFGSDRDVTEEDRQETEHEGNLVNALCDAALAGRAAQEDAGRYNALVDQAFWRGSHCIQLFGEFSDHEGRGVASRDVKKSCMDAAIDAARKTGE